MKRRLVLALLALAVPLALASPAAAVPPQTNKNADYVNITCGGKSYTGVANNHSNIDGVIHVLGVGTFKVVEISAFDPATHEELFSDTGNFPKKPNTTCTGTITDVDPDTGEEFTFDFTLTGYLRSK